MSKEVEKGATITIILDEEKQSFLYSDTEDNIVDAAQDAGIDAPFSCMAGVCTSCLAKIVKGEVIMGNVHSLSDEEIEDGFILACQAKPASVELIISFDDV